MGLSPELVNEWIGAFCIYARLYAASLLNKSCMCIITGHTHRSESTVMSCITNGNVAPKDVYFVKSVMIGENMATEFLISLPTGFHNPISSRIKTMKQLKRGIKVGEKIIFDLETIFLRLLMIGQQRQLQLAPIFTYELCAVSPSIIDEYGCLRKGNKSALARRLGVKQVAPQDPDVVIVDAQQLLYHSVWPCSGNASVLADSMKWQLNHFHKGPGVRPV